VTKKKSFYNFYFRSFLEETSPGKSSPAATTTTIIDGKEVRVPAGIKITSAGKGVVNIRAIADSRPAPTGKSLGRVPMAASPSKPETTSTPAAMVTLTAGGVVKSVAEKIVSDDEDSETTDDDDISEEDEEEEGEEEVFDEVEELAADESQPAPQGEEEEPQQQQLPTPPTKPQTQQPTPPLTKPPPPPQQQQQQRPAPQPQGPPVKRRGRPPKDARFQSYKTFFFVADAPGKLASVSHSRAFYSSRYLRVR
jgi:hypothetical protein